MAEPGPEEDGAASSAMLARLRQIGWSRVALSLLVGSVFAVLAWQAPAAAPGVGPLLRWLFGATAGLQFAAAAMMLWRLRQR